MKSGQDNSYWILIMSLISLVVSVNDNTRCTPCKQRFFITILLFFFIEVIQMWVTNLQTPQPIFTWYSVQTLKRLNIFLFSKISMLDLWTTQTDSSFHGSKGLGHVDDHSPPSSIEIKNKWNYTSIHTICLQGNYRNNFTIFTTNIYTHLTITNLPAMPVEMYIFLGIIINIKSISWIHYQMFSQLLHSSKYHSTVIWYWKFYIFKST